MFEAETKEICNKFKASWLEKKSLSIVTTLLFGLNQSTSTFQLWLLPIWGSHVPIWKPGTGGIWREDKVISLQGTHQVLICEPCALFYKSLFLLLQFIFDAPEKCHVVCRREYKKGDKQSKKKLDFIKKGIRMNYQQVRFSWGFSKLSNL